MSQPHSVKTIGSYTYILSDQHRNRQNRNKSQWTINEVEEVNSFELMILKNYWVIDNNKGWSLHRENNSENYILGSSTENDSLQIAKFVDSSNNKNWHGYPVDYRKSVHDRPHISILEDWVNQGIIKKKDKARILLGKGRSI